MSGRDRGEPGLGTDDALQATLDALASPVRRDILWMLGDDELPAGAIAEAFDLTAPTISTHLGVLRSAGLVTMRADGNFRRYRVDRRALDAVLPLLAASSERWRVADDVPERAHAEARLSTWITVAVEPPGWSQADAFEALTDGDRYSAWLGAPVSIVDGRFSAEMEWGTTVRGRYEVIVPPELIAMRWDFEDDEVPLPGRALVGYLRCSLIDGGAGVEVHQRANDATETEYLATAWRTVLGRLAAYAEANPPGAPGRRRPRRAKRAT